jgi:hypothetical protein
MINSLEAVDIVWKRLYDSPLRTTITGGIYKQKRPQNSKLEDVVVNSLPIVNLQLQESIMNVNIYVPNLVITVNGTQDSSQPDHQRLKELTEIASGILIDVWSEDAQIHYDILQQSTFDVPEIDHHYSNFRLTFYSVNI